MSIIIYHHHHHPCFQYARQEERGCRHKYLFYTIFIFTNFQAYGAKALTWTGSEERYMICVWTTDYI